MGRSAGNDSGRSFFVGSPPEGGYRKSRGSRPEDRVPSGKSWAWRNGSAGARGRSADRLECLRAELAQGVETAPGELAGDRQRRPRVREPALLERQVVGAVGARRTSGRLRRLIKRPAQLRRALLGELAGPRAPIGAMDADVEAGASDRLARGREPGNVAELAEDHRRGQLTDAVVGHQRPTARLAAGCPAQLALDRGELAVDRRDHLERDLDPLPRGVGQIEAIEKLAPASGSEPLGDPAYAVVKERRLDPLKPGGALVDQCLSEPGAGPKLLDMGRRDPGPRKPARGQQRPQPTGVLSVGLRPALGAT